MKQADTAIANDFEPGEFPRRRSQCDRIIAFLTESGRARTLKEISFALSLPDSTVSGRLNEMREEGKVDTYLTRECEINGVRKHTWFLAPEKCQDKLFSGGKS